MSRHPEVKWAQREDKLYLTVQLPDAKDAKVNLDPEGTFTFTASGGAGDNDYELKLDLFDKVNVEESKINYGPRNIFCIVEKAEKIWWKKLLRGDDKPPHFVKVDWDKWADEDDEDTGPADMDMGGMDFSKFANMGGMGGMGMPGMGGMGMPGMGDMGMPGMGGMGMPGMGDMGMGMPGMGMPGMGMPGMGMPGMGMPGMGGPEEFEDSDDEDDEATKPEGQETGDAGATTSAKTEA